MLNRASIILLSLIILSTACKRKKDDPVEPDKVHVTGVVELKNKIEEEGLEINIVTPYFQISDSNVQKTINDSIASLVDDIRNRFMDGFQESFKEITSQLDITYDTFRTNDILSFMIWTDWYLGGEPFPLAYREQFNFQLNTGQVLELPDLFSGDTIPAGVLTAMFNNYIANDEDPGCILNDSTIYEMSNSYAMMQDTLLLFHPYQEIQECIEIMVMIPFSKLNELKPEVSGQSPPL